MILGDLIGPTTRLYAKSEWAPAGPLWPALSFSQRGVANRFGSIYTRGTDFVITVGTGDPNDTQDPAHRRRLLSLVDVAPNILVSTSELVDPEAWQRAQQTHPERWKLSMPIVRCWTFTDFPYARTDMATTYRKFGNPTNRGRPIRVDDSDRTTLLALPLTPVDIPPYIEQRLHPIPADRLLNQEFTRVIEHILGSVARAGTERSGVYPERISLSFVDLLRLFGELWNRQHGRCNLCNAAIVPGEENLLLRLSADRIDSANKRYDETNVHLTHVGCNLAKSSAPLQDWQEFLGVLRGNGANSP